MKPKLTIGMAHHEDSDMLWATIQSLKIHHGIMEKPVEVIIVDNSPPDSDHLNTVRSIATWLGDRDKLGKGKVIIDPELQGTARSRQHIFDIARGEFVLCMDCHVLLAPGAIDRTLEAIDNGDLGDNLYQAPLVMDDNRRIQTCFNMQWGGQMWGQWGQIWECNDCKAHFSVMQDNGLAKFVPIDLHPHKLRKCPGCDKQFPPIMHSKHPNFLLKQFGAKILGSSLDDDSFRIQCQGLGLFLAKKETWLGFNRSFRGFGGEEGYIHAKYEKAGRKTISLPFLRWNHKFSDAKTKKYPLRVFDKIRNYVLGFQELEMENELEAMTEHFVSVGIDNELIEQIIKDPMNARESSRGMMADNQLKLPTEAKDLGQVIEYCSDHPRDLNEHFKTIIDETIGAERVVEISLRRESSAALLLAHPKKLISVNLEKDPKWYAMLERMKFENTAWHRYDSIETMKSNHSQQADVDVVFIDFPIKRGQLDPLLEYFRRANRIMIHDTILYPELQESIKDFLEENPTWFGKSHHPQQHGLAVLSRVPEEKPEDPIDFVHPGAKAWAALHSYNPPLWNPKNVAEWYFGKWTPTIPQVDCKCKEHWKQLTEALPPDFSSRRAFFQWSVAAHNAVNQRLKKPIFSHEDALEKWKPNLST